MKKTIITVAFVAAFALTASAVLADSCCWPYYKTCCPEVNVNNINNSTVRNATVSLSNTGANTVKNWGWGGSSVSTGYAGAAAGTENQVGYNGTEVKMMPVGKVNVNSVNNSTVSNLTGAAANSGMNKIVSTKCGTANITTGGAGASAQTVNVVGSNVTKVY